MLPADRLETLWDTKGNLMAKKAKTQQPKELRLNVRATPAELALWTEAAQSDGRKMAGWVKWTLTRAAKSQLGKQ